MLLNWQPNLKELTAIVLLACGIIMAFIALMLPPPGEIHDSVLYIFAQILIYCGSIFTRRVTSINSAQALPALEESPQFHASHQASASPPTLGLFSCTDAEQITEITDKQKFISTGTAVKPVLSATFTPQFRQIVLNSSHFQ